MGGSVAVRAELWWDSAMRRSVAGFVAGLVLLVSGCGTAAPEPEAEASKPGTPDSAVAAMSDEELAGQVLMPYRVGDHDVVLRGLCPECRS